MGGQNYEIQSQNYKLVNQNSDFLSQNYEIIYIKLVSHTFNLIYTLNIYIWRNSYYHNVYLT